MDRYPPQHIPPPHWQHLWEERGFKGIKVEDRDPEDPRGEEAYQRQFAKALQNNRVPNPSYYVNSPSAQEYIRNRDQELFKKAAPPNPEGKIRNPNFRTSAQSPESAQSLTNTHSPASSGSHDPTSPLEDRSKPPPRPGEMNAVSERPWPSQPSLSRPMEPQIAPIGPPRMLR
ncbi:MAG: hypothetical protein Q9227_003950 [Pyrenula ochraceoflavens]